MMAENPFVRFHNAERGDARCSLTPRQWTTDFQVAPVVSRPESPLVTRATFVLESGRPGLRK